MSDLDTLIAEHHHELHTHDGLHPAAILHALAEVESDHGARRLATLHEPAYCYGGFYYKGPNGADLRNLSTAWGCLAHCSYGSWQIMFMSAYEQGFRGDPCELRNDAVGLPWVLRFLNRRILDKYPRITLPNIADAWNSGKPFDANKPVAYIEKFVEAHTRWLERLTP